MASLYAAAPISISMLAALSSTQSPWKQPFCSSAREHDAFARMLHKRVAARLEQLCFGGNAREYAAVLQRARERLGVPNGNYAWPFRERAAGVYDDSQSECINALRDQTTNYSRVPPPVRAYALARAAGTLRIDEVSVPPLRKLVSTAKELDTIQFIEQPH